MAMTTPARLWVRVSLLMTVLLFVSARRFLAPMPSLATALTAIMVVAFLAALGTQAWRWYAASGKRRQCETALLLSYLGLLVAGLLYFATTKTGLGWVGMAEATPKSLAKFDTIMTLAAAIVCVCALLPAIFMEATVGEWTTDDPDDAVEFQRVREMGVSGLTIGLAAALLFVTCNVAKQKNVKKDVSYFKTAAPGESTRKIVSSMKEPVRVLLFFPEVNEVGEEVEGYFRELARQTGKIAIERHDRMVSAQLAQKYQVQKDGTVVLIKGSAEAATPPTPGAATDKFGKFDLDTDFDRARRQTGKLRILDQTVNTELLKLVREKRKAYLTVGHAELNDPDSLPVQYRGRYPDAKSVVIKAILGQLNYEVKNLATMDLIREVPADATLVMILGPKTRFESGELTSLTRYLDGGGRVLVALDPEGEFELGPLAAYLGVGLDRRIIHDDKNYTPERGQPTDRALALTNGFSSHPATTSLSRGAANQAILLQTSGALVEQEFTVPGDKPKRTIILRSMGEAWLDGDGNHAFDGATEKRDRYPVGAALEGPARKLPDGTDGEPWRALVFADSDLFADRVFQTLTGQKALDTNSRTLPDDSIRWLGGEEAFAGIVNTEKEKELTRSKKQQSLWFLLSTLLAPVLVLGMGVAYALASRRRRSAGKLLTTPEKSS